MTRAFLSLGLWSLCIVIGLLTTHQNARNAEKGEHLYEKWIRLLWAREENKEQEIKLEEERHTEKQGEEL